MTFYMAFWILYNVYLPSNFHCFLEYLIEPLAVWHKVWEKPAEDNHEGSSSFDNNWLNPEIRTWFALDMYNHFII